MSAGTSPEDFLLADLPFDGEAPEIQAALIHSKFRMFPGKSADEKWSASGLESRSALFYLPADASAILRQTSGDIVILASEVLRQYADAFRRVA